MKNLLLALLLLLSLSLIPHVSHAQINATCTKMAPGAICGNPSASTATPVPVIRGALLSQFDVTAYGAKCDGTTDDATAINAAFAAARTASATTFTGLKIIFPAQKKCNVASSINATGFTRFSSRLIVEGQAATIMSITGLTGPIIDAMGSVAITWQNLTVYGYNGTPTTGIQIGRLGTSDQGGHQMFFKNFSAQGSFSLAACYSFASETTHWDNVQCQNQYVGTSATSPGDGLILDGASHFNVGGTATSYPSFVFNAASIDVPVSFQENLIENSQFSSDATSFGAPIWMEATMQHRFVNDYADQEGTATGSTGACVWIWAIAPSGTYRAVRSSTFDVHCESTPAEIFWITGPGSGAHFTATPAFQTLRYSDPFVFATTSIFAIDPASNITGLTINNLDLDISGGPTTPTFIVFDNPANYTVSGRGYFYATGIWNGSGTNSSFVDDEVGTVTFKGNLNGTTFLNGVDSTGATDVSAAVQTQLNAATAAGQCLRVLPGTYLFASPLTAPSGTTCIVGTPGKSIFKASPTNTGSALLFRVAASVNSINIPGFLIDSMVLDGGMPVRGLPPNTVGTGCTANNCTDATLSTFTGSTTGTTLTVTAVLSGTLYAGHTVFDSGGNLSGLGAPSLITISGASLPITNGSGCLPSCIVTLSSAPATTSSETMYTTNHTQLISTSAPGGYTSRASLAHWGCDNFIIQNSTIQNVARTLGNFSGCNNSKISNVIFNNTGAGGNDYNLTANLPFNSWNAAGVIFSPYAQVSSAATTVTLNVTAASCGIYFLFNDDQAVSTALYPLIAETTPNQFILNGTYVTGVSFTNGATCGVSGNTVTFAAGSGGGGNMILTLSQATSGIIATSDTIKVYDNPATGNTIDGAIFNNFGSATIDIGGQQGFRCTNSVWNGNYATGNVTSSGGGNSSCYAQGSVLPGNYNTVISNIYVDQMTGNGADHNGGVGTVFTGSVINRSGRSGLSITSNGAATSENPIVTLDGYSGSGLTIRNSNYSTSPIYQTGTGIVNGNQTGTGGSPLTSLNVTSVTGTCAPNSYISSTGFAGYPYPTGTSSQAGIFGSTWSSPTIILSTGLIGTINNGSTIYCNSRNPNPAVSGTLDANITLGVSPNSAISTVQNVSISSSVLRDDQFATTPTATLNTSGTTSSGNVLPFSSTTGVVVGQQVYCTGAQPFTQVASFVVNTSVTLTTPIATTVASGAPCYFYNALPTTAYAIDVAPNTTLLNVAIAPDVEMSGNVSGNLSATAKVALAASTASQTGPSTVNVPAVTVKPVVAPVTDAGNVPFTAMQSGVPFIVSACTLTQGTGGLSACTTITNTFGKSYMYFGAAVLAAAGTGSAAGFYAVNMTNSTTGQVCSPIVQYVSGSPSIPATCNTFTTNAGTGTQTPPATILTGPTFTLPAHSMGLNGSLECEARSLQTNSAGTKTLTLTFGTEVINVIPTTTVNSLLRVKTINAGSESAQTVAIESTAATAATLQTPNSAVQSVATSSNQTVSFSETLNTPASDSAVIEAYSCKVWPN